jgi:hypothetical protein
MIGFPSLPERLRERGRGERGVGRVCLPIEARRSGEEGNQRGEGAGTGAVAPGI